MLVFLHSQIDPHALIGNELFSFTSSLGRECRLHESRVIQTKRKWKWEFHSMSPKYINIAILKGEHSTNPILDRDGFIMFCITPIYQCCTAVDVSLSMGFKLWKRNQNETWNVREEFFFGPTLLLIYCSLYCITPSSIYCQSVCCQAQPQPISNRKKPNKSNTLLTQQSLRLSSLCGVSIETLIHFNLKSHGKRFPLHQWSREKKN